MRIIVLAVGSRMPGWVPTAVQEYAKRMPAHCSLEVREVPAVKRGKNPDIRRVLVKEGEALLKAIPKNALVIALERSGREISTGALADKMREWIDANRDVVMLVGGPEGLSGQAMEHASHVWSLSRMTFAHPVVRVILAEQIYRAWSICAGLPYHRGA